MTDAHARTFAVKPTLAGEKVILRPFLLDQDAPALRAMLQDRRPRPGQPHRTGNKRACPLCFGGMPLTGDYEPSAAQWARDQLELYESSGGTEGTELNGRPVIILTMMGAKTGKVRKTPLMRVEHDGQYAVIASLGGAPRNPVWYYNLIANPHVELQDGPVKKDYRASEVHGSERELWWELAVAAWPDYAQYQTKTTRTIPVFVLTAIGA